MFKKIFLYILVVLSANAMLFGGEPIRVVEKTSTRIRFQARFEQPQFQIIEKNGSSFTRISSGNSANGISIHAKLLHLNSDGAQLSVRDVKTNRMPGPPPLTENDRALAGQNQSVAQTFINPFQQSEPVKLRYLGRFRGAYLWSLQIYPCLYDESSGEWLVYKDILFDILIPPPLEKVQIFEKDKEFLQRLSDISVTQNTRAPKTPLTKMSASTHPRWKLFVQKDGLYRITGSDLREAGVDLLDIDIRKIRLTCNGHLVPVYVHGWQDGQFDREDYFEFWGEYNRQTLQHKAPDLYRDPFTDTSVYWLSWEEKGHWMPKENGGVAELEPGSYKRPYSFHHTVHMEKDLYYDRLSTIPGDSLRDHWFWDSGLQTGKKKTYEFDLVHPDDQSTLNTYLNVMLSGRTTKKDAVHDVSVYLNDSYAMQHQWLGQDYAGLRSQDSHLTGADVQHGSNQLTITNNISPEKFDFVLMNWFEITYPRLYRAHNGLLKFTIPPNADPGLFLFKIDGFANRDIDIYKLGHSKIAGGFIEQITDFENYTSYQISFQDHVYSAGTEYVAVAQHAKMKPLLIEQEEPAYLRNPQNAADYVIVTHQKFIDSPDLQRLAELRQSQNMQVLTVDVQDIYDEFNYGRPSSYAVKAFLRYAFENWQNPGLEYVLFVGDGCYVRQSAAGDTLDFVPVHMRQTVEFGSAASDFWYTLLDGEDNVPDVFLGRLPVREKKELKLIVDKIINYEQGHVTGTWRNRQLLIGGNGSAFRSQAMSLAHGLSPAVDTRLLFTLKDESVDYDPFFGGTADLLDYFDQGCALMSFHGHGGGAVWADNGLLRMDDVSRIYVQGKLPVILSFTCFTGAFESPSRESLADVLLFSTDGAVAVFGASGVGWMWNDYYLEKEILNYLNRNPEQTLGEILTAGKILYAARYQTKQRDSELHQYHLLGDPALRLNLPEKTAPVSVKQTGQNAGDTLYVSADTPFKHGSASFALVDSQRVTHVIKEVSVANGKAESHFVLDAVRPRATGYIRLYASDEFTADIHGWAPFSTRDVVFDSTFSRHHNDSLYVFAKIHHQKPLKNVWVKIMGDSIPMRINKDGWYETIRGRGIIWRGFNAVYTVHARTVEGHTFKSKEHAFFINYGIDPGVRNRHVMLEGESHVYLAVTVDNFGDHDAFNVPVVFQVKDSANGEWQTIGSDTIDIKAAGSQRARVTFAPGLEPFRAQAWIDPAEKTEDADRTNNSVITGITPHVFQLNSGFQVNSSHQNTLRFEHLALEYAPETFSQPAALFIEPMDSVTILEQPDFAPVARAPAYNLWTNVETSLQQPMDITLDVPDESISENDSSGVQPAIFRFHKKTQKWIRCHTRIEKNKMIASLAEISPVAVLHATDTRAPDISLSIDGQPFVFGKYISSKPHIALRIQDINGIDVSARNFNIHLDGESLVDAETAADSVTNGNQMVFDLQPSFDAGMHRLSVIAADCNGNESPLTEYDLKIAEHFELRMLGNYPNPFVDETRFAYMVTQPCRKIVLNIYTASGRLIRHLDARDSREDPAPLSADYHELLWDGADDEGYPVANGVYFYRLKAETESKKKQVTGKIARIQ